jgi:hypothetical protein
MSSSVLVAVLVLACAGCPRSGQGGDCEYNDECTPDVCGRDHACTAASNVREVTVTWTVHGADANVQTCAPKPDMTLTFVGDTIGDELGFEPVPCATGMFFVDRLPKRFHSVDLGLGGRRIPINSDGTAMGDFLP